MFVAVHFLPDPGDPRRGNTGPGCCLSGCVEAQISLRMARPESEQSGHNPSWNFVVMLLLVPPGLAWAPRAPGLLATCNLSPS